MTNIDLALTAVLCTVVTCFAGSAVAAENAALRPRGAYILQAPLPTVQTPLVGERTIYMNRHGGVFTPGDDDSSRNTSAIPLQTSRVSAWSYGDADWNLLMTCMRDVFAPFHVEITDVDPGDRVHVEAVIGGLPGEVQMPDDVAGVAATYGCEVFEAGVVYSFSEVWREYGSGHVENTCFTAAQEVGHAYGLDHQLTCGDPMTYLQCAGSFEFHDEEGDCGEDVPRACSCSGTTQNSHAKLMALLGPADVEPPNDGDEPGDPSDAGDAAPGGQVASGCSSTGTQRSGPSALLLLLCVLGTRAPKRRRAACATLVIPLSRSRSRRCR